MINLKSVNLILSVITCFCFISIPERVSALPQPLLEINSTRESPFIINYWTQYFFDLLRPELVGKEQSNYSKLHRREKSAISEIVVHILSYTCQRSPDKYFVLTEARELNDSDKYPRYRYYPKGHNRNLYNRERNPDFNLEDNNIRDISFHWRLERDYFFEGLYKDLTDAIFYARHPEFSVQENKKLQHLNWSAEWNFIRRHFANYNQEQVYKQFFIPSCRNDSQQ